MSKLKYFTLDAIKKKHAHYNIIFGERSNGKTFAVLREGLMRYFEDGSQMAIIRRYDEDFIGGNSMRTCFNSLMCDGNGRNQIAELSGGKYTGVDYYGKRYYLTVFDEESGKERRTDQIIAYAFSLTSMEHSKSASFPKIRTILFDEFMTRGAYLTGEFVLFSHTISTIIRTRDDVTIYMCANTVNQYGCIYFTEMGLYRVKNMQEGDIDVYKWGESGLIIAVQWAGGIAKKKPSDVYFSFENPALKVITGGGKWEMDVYPHCPHKYRPADIMFRFFILYDEQLLQCEVIYLDNADFIFVHRKTTELKDEENDLIYSTEYDPRSNYRRRITVPRTNIEKRILSYFLQDRVYYQDNEVGEIVRNYLLWCKQN